MSLMKKRSFRHWQKLSKKSITKITKPYIVLIKARTIKKKLADKPYFDCISKTTWIHARKSIVIIHFALH
jgi:hypothetical protein